MGCGSSKNVIQGTHTLNNENVNAKSSVLSIRGNRENTNTSSSTKHGSNCNRNNISRSGTRTRNSSIDNKSNSERCNLNGDNISQSRTKRHDEDIRSDSIRSILDENDISQTNISHSDVGKKTNSESIILDRDDISSSKTGNGNGESDPHSKISIVDEDETPQSKITNPDDDELSKSEIINLNEAGISRSTPETSDRDNDYYSERRIKDVDVISLPNSTYSDEEKQSDLGREISKEDEIPQSEIGNLDEDSEATSKIKKLDGDYKSNNSEQDERSNSEIIILDRNNISRSNTGTSIVEYDSQTERIIKDEDDISQSQTTTYDANNRSQGSILDQTELSQFNNKKSDEDSKADLEIIFSNEDDKSRSKNGTTNGDNDSHSETQNKDCDDISISKSTNSNKGKLSESERIISNADELLQSIIRNMDSDDLSKSKNNSSEADKQSNSKIIILNGKKFSITWTSVVDDDSHSEIKKDGDDVSQSDTTTSDVDNGSNKERSIMDETELSHSKIRKLDEELESEVFLQEVINVNEDGVSRSNNGTSDEEKDSHTETIIKDGDDVSQSKTTTCDVDKGSISEKSSLKKDDVDLSQSTTQKSDEDSVSQCGVGTSNGENESQLTNFNVIDDHARKAPDALRSSAEDLINYLTTPSKEPKMVVRAIFVWITDNISYDLDGLQGRAAMKSCDAQYVMKSGSCVCEGYANVMQLLCRTANIPVKKISGYSKGLGYSADKPLTLKSKTDHAWNAVQLDGQWYLMDSTWGSGHLDGSNKSVKEFKEFYFMTDPKHFISDHFPYMDSDLAASMKWQLLDKPVSLEEFSRNIRIRSGGFKLGIVPISHTESVIKMQNELEMSFKTDVKNVTFSSTLMFKNGNVLQSLPQNTFDQFENGILKINIHPNKKGKYKLELFGKEEKDGDHGDNSLPQLLDYAIECTDVTNAYFEYPTTYGQAQIDKCILLQPLRGNIPANTSTKFCVKAPRYFKVKVGGTYLEMNGIIFEGMVVTGPKGTSLSVFGSKEEYGRILNGLYKFKII